MKSSATIDYTTAVATCAAQLVEFLRVFERVQENIDFRAIGAAQAQLSQHGVGQLVAATDDLDALLPPSEHAAMHAQLCAAVGCWARAANRFLGGTGADIGQTFVDSRRLLCEGLALAYPLRTRLPALQAYWLGSAAPAEVSRLDALVPGVEVPRGVIHHTRGENHTEYALYVPESYTPEYMWPLIVCLHGAYGHGDEYLWTWVRAARSARYLVLAPTSSGPTWSIMKPPQDIESIRAMLTILHATYQIDPRRIYLSGLSDGGSFAYIAGLSCPLIFAGIAPVAGVLHPMTDELLRAKQGLSVPLFVVHGARDPIFDVRTVRSGCELMQKIGYQLTYTELPEWGHAYTNTINEQLVMPWFASLAQHV
jgi:predicted esterase